MDFTNLLKAIEEFLYELVAWVIFYPLTLFKAMIHPLEMMRYAERELGDSLDGQYDDTMSPPIFLVISLLIAHLVQIAFAPQLPGGPLPDVFRDERNLLLFRAVALGFFPLLLAFQTVRVRKVKLNRRSLQPAFYAQCFVAAPFVLGEYIALTVAEHGGVALPTGLALAGICLVWYAVGQARWLVSIGSSRFGASVRACGMILLGLVAVLVFTAAATLTAQRVVAG